ncbi:cache domain-containing protein [Pelagibacterium xiamenense]|uniref:cache domain-containing protein n=1 Tax=Pelagibacterium xiamenense TaxID=2901140 RepID=UPI001E34156D|nr:cache domain-containing protein [Pelagibacterium xiamenense]MCD7059628.1 cache domain-containing protein [Pelagibacterium xiamenense]
MQLRHQILALSVVPLVLAILAITTLVTWQSTQLARTSIDTFERNMLKAKQTELLNLTNLAISAISEIYQNAGPDDEEAKQQVRDILSSLDYGEDGYFFVYDYDGNNVVHPRQPFRVGVNWIDLQDANGDYVIANLIEKAREGGGLHQYLWEKPSAETIAEKLSFAVGLDKWEWMLGTGVYLDDVYAQTAAANADLRASINSTFLTVALIAVPSVLLVFGTWMFLNLHERRLADTKLKELTQRVIDTQEEERSRIARELHDGISQILIGARYTIDLARRKVQSGGEGAPEAIDKGADALNGAIKEVRRLSHDLRPPALDDLGLSAALEALAHNFTERTGIPVELEAVAFKNVIIPESKTALYRVAQEALNNIERHASASAVTLRLSSPHGRVQMVISDNGRGFAEGNRKKPGARSGGLGLRNMQERMAHFGGSLLVETGPSGTTLHATLPKTVFIKSAKLADVA